MSGNRDDYYNLAERIEDAFAEIDSDIVTDLPETDSEYASMHEEVVQVKQEYLIIEKVLEGDGAISLTDDEHKALARYISLTRQMEDMERQAIYFRGHTDCFAYLKRIGAI